MLKLTSNTQWIIAAYTALAFLIIINPLTFKLVNFITEKVGFPVTNNKGCANGWGLILHGAVFFFVVRFFILPYLLSK